ncbi:unnamed protein product [Merluccius merluccius]
MRTRRLAGHRMASAVVVFRFWGSSSAIQRRLACATWSAVAVVRSWRRVVAMVMTWRCVVAMRRITSAASLQTASSGGLWGANQLWLMSAVPLVTGVQETISLQEASRRSPTPGAAPPRRAPPPPPGVPAEPGPAASTKGGWAAFYRHDVHSQHLVSVSMWEALAPPRAAEPLQGPLGRDAAEEETPSLGRAGQGRAGSLEVWVEADAFIHLTVPNCGADTASFR